MKQFPGNIQRVANKNSQKPVTLVKIDIPAFQGLPAKILRLATTGTLQSPGAYSTENFSWKNIILDIGKIDAKSSAKNGSMLSDTHFSITVINSSSDLFNPPKPLSAIFSDYCVGKATVMVYQEFADEGLTEADLVVLFVGRITGPEQWNGHTCKFDVISLSNIIGKQTIGRVITLADYPDAPESSVGRLLPIPIGRVIVPGIPVYKTAQTKLTGVLLPDDTIASVYSTEGFPASGTFLIGQYKIAYTGKTATTFTGCSGIIEIHYNDDPVIEKITNYSYAFFDDNYPVKSILKVLNQGHLVPGKDYSMDASKGLATFKEKPYFLEASDSRFWYAHFDAADSSNTSLNPLNAIDSNDTSDSAQIDKVRRVFAVKQTDALKNQGQIGRVFIQIAHREDGDMPNDSLAVEIDGIGKVGKLSKPGAGDSVGISGSPDFSLTVVDSIAVSFSDRGHNHGISGGASSTQQNANSGVGTQLHRLWARWSHVVGFPSYSGSPVRIEYSIPIHMSSLLHAPMAIYINGQKLLSWDRNVWGSVSGSYSTTTRANSVRLTANNRHGNHIQIFSGTRTLHYSAGSIQVNQTGASVAKAGTVKVTKSAIDMSRVKVSGGSNSFTDKIEITSHVGGDWDWFTNKVLRIKYTGTKDNRKSHIIVARFVIEYAFSKVVYSENITADIKGVKDDALGTITGNANALIERPDHVYKWSILNLLGEDASLIDTASFTGAGSKFSQAITGGYKFSGLIAEKQEIRKLWQKFSRECRSVFYFDNGKAKIFFRPQSKTNPVKFLNRSNIYHPDKKPPLLLKRTPIDQVANLIDLNYKRNWAQFGDYKAVTHKEDADSIGRYGARERSGEFNFDFVVENAMAEDLGSFYLGEKKAILTWVEFEAFLGTMDVEAYDIIAIAHDHIDSNGSYYNALVMGASRQFGLGSKKRPDLVKLAVVLSPDAAGRWIEPKPATVWAQTSISSVNIFIPPVEVTPNAAKAYTKTSVSKVVLGSVTVRPQPAKAYTNTKLALIQIIQPPLEVTPQSATAFCQTTVSEVSVDVLSRHSWLGVGAILPTLDTGTKKFGAASIRFNGRNWIEAPDHDDWTLAGAVGSGAFTFEYQLQFANYSHNPQYSFVYQQDSFEFYLTGGYLRFSIRGSRAYYQWNPSAGPKYHMALVKRGNDIVYKVYINGIELAPAGSNRLGRPIPIASKPLKLGVGLDGWMDEFRLSNIARYTSNFTPPLEPFTVDVNTKSLLHFDGSNGSTKISDSASQTVVIATPLPAIAFCRMSEPLVSAAGSPMTLKARAFCRATVSEVSKVSISRPSWLGGGATLPALDTATKKFGAASIRFNGRNWIESPDHTAWQLGAASAGSFTFEAFVKFNGRWPHANFVSQYKGFFFDFGAGYFNITVEKVGIQLFKWPANTSNWYHIAWVSSQNTYSIYVDGTPLTKVFSAKPFVIPASPNPLKIGRRSTGWMDEVRISNVARYTSNFTPPSQAFVDDANTLSLLHFDGENSSTRIIESASAKQY